MASEQEAVQVLQWASEYPEVAAELEAIEAGILQYAMANELQPDPAVKEKIFAGINEPPTGKLIPVTDAAGNNSLTTVGAYWKYIAAACMLLLVVSAVMNVLQYNKKGEMQQALDQRTEMVSMLEEKNKAMEDNWRVVQSRYSQPVTVNGLEATPGAQAKVFWMKNSGEVYVDPSNLPEAPEGKQYELWAIVNGAPVNAGIIITTKKGVAYSIQKMKSFGQVDAFAVSLEKLSTTPAEKPGEVIALGKM